MLRRRLIGKYSQVILAGAAIGVVAPAFKDWHKAFWDNLAASVQLHSIKKVIVINHRDCGAAKIAYGADSVKTRDAETALHRTVLAEFRKQCNDKQPKLAVETGLISLRARSRCSPDAAQSADRPRVSRPARAASRRGPDRPPRA